MALKKSASPIGGLSGTYASSHSSSNGADRARERSSQGIDSRGRPAANPGGHTSGVFTERLDLTGGVGSNGGSTRKGEIGRLDETPFLSDDVNCPMVREILSRVGDKWSARILALLAGGPRRFSEVKKALPEISQRMLSHTLRGLERDGVLVRAVYPTIPPKVEYALSPTGRSLLTILDDLASWARRNQEEIERARDAFRRRMESEGLQLNLPGHDAKMWDQSLSAGRDHFRDLALRSAAALGRMGRRAGEGRS